MITLDVFVREVHRATSFDDPRSLNICKWLMTHGGSFHDDRLRELHEMVAAAITTERELVAFTTWLLAQKDDGAIEAYPDAKEMKELLHEWRLLHTPDPLKQESWRDPHRTSAQESRLNELLNWWNGVLTAEGRKLMKEKVIDNLKRSGNMSMALYLECSNKWDDVERSPVILSQLMEMRE